MFMMHSRHQDNTDSMEWDGDQQLDEDEAEYEHDDNDGSYNEDNEQHDAPQASTSTAIAAEKTSSAPPRPKQQQQKKKITRIRPLRSCLSCNRRKIKCDRKLPCDPCAKRGEGDACSLVAGLNAAHLTNAAIVDRLCQLEARVEELEYSSTSRSPSTLVDGVIQQQQQRQGSSAPSPLSNHKKGRRASTKPSVSALEHSNTPTDPRSSQHTLPTVNTNGQLADSQGDPNGLASINGITVDGQDESQDIKQDEAYSAANCETEEAALALESLCKTGDVLDRNRNDSTRGSFSLPSVVNPSVLSLNSNNQKLPGISTILPGPLLMPASGSKPLEANESQTRVNSPAIRQHRSTIVVDPATHGVTSTTTTTSSSSTTSNNSIGGHRLQRSLEVRLRILTSSNFPSKDFCDYVTGNYFRYLDPLWHVHIGWLFDDEYKAFWKLRNEGRFMEIDPAWGALFFMTLALGLQVTELPLPQHLLPHPSSTSADILALSDSYISDVEELLNAANWARIPQVRVLQTLALLSAFQSIISLRDATTFTMNGAGVRIAQILGLHNLGDVKTTLGSHAVSATLLADDIAVPTGNHALKEHLARIIWHTLVVLEMVHVTRSGITVPLASTPYTTQLPANVDDIDFQNLSPGANVKAKPAWQLTSVSSLHLRSLVSRIDKRLLDLPSDMKPMEKYTHVMNIDAELRKWISASPTRQTAQQDYAAYKLSQWQHWSLMADVHGAIVHAHRPYMTRGYVDQRFSFSTKTCLESAKILCESWKYLQDYITDQRFWWTTMRYLSAALVIFIDLFTAMDDGCPEDILATKRADIPLICTILQERMQSIYSTTSTFAGAAYGVVSNLLEAEKVKKAALHARRNSADGNLMEEAEPVGRVFKRIAQSMSESALKAEPPSTNPSSNPTTTQSSPQPGATTTTMQGALLEQPTFAQPAIAKKSGKQARRTSYAAGDTGRANKQTKTSTEHYRRPSVLDSMPDAEAPGRKLSSPGIIPPPMPAVSSSSTPAFAIDSTLATSRQGSYSSATQNSVPWQSSSQYAQEQPKQQGHGYMPDGHYASTSSHMQLPFSHRYNGDVSAPITWDTSPLFHPDPSVLLHSIGFPASHQQADAVFPRPGNEIQQQNSMAVHDPAAQPPSSASQYGLNTQANTHNSTWYSDNASHY